MRAVDFHRPFLLIDRLQVLQFLQGNACKKTSSQWDGDCAQVAGSTRTFI